MNKTTDTNMDLGIPNVPFKSFCLIRIDEQNDVLGQIIKEYGVVKALRYNDFKRHDYRIHDFYFFCLTKAFKTLISAEILIHKGLSEDSQTLLRTAYECYIVNSYLNFDKSRIKELIDYKLGLQHGFIKHPKNRKGQPNRSKIIDPISGEELNFSLAINKMISNNGRAEDLVLHRFLFRHLSEHTHVNFMTSGNYRNEEKKRYDPNLDKVDFQPITYSLIVGTMLLYDVIKFKRHINEELSEQLYSCLDLNIMTIQRIIENSPDTDEFKEAILAKLSVLNKDLFI